MMRQTNPRTVHVEEDIKFVPVVVAAEDLGLLSWESEGTEVAEWLRARGVVAFVLNYRLMDTGATEASRLQNPGPALRRPALRRTASFVWATS
jgi:hypothetical protein